MKNLISILFAITFIMNGCNGQTKTEQDLTSKTKPNTNIKVNKEYDKNGNLLKFDSTYTSYYSNIDTSSVMRNKTYNDFIKEFNKLYFFSTQPYFNHLFFNDTLLKYDFYKKDFFSNRFKSNLDQMDRLFWEMDSMKNDFYKQKNNPGDIKKKK